MTVEELHDGKDGQFGSIWADALAKHAETVGNDPKGDKMPMPTSTNALLDEIDIRQARFAEFRSKRQKLFHVLDLSLRPVELVGHLAEGAASNAFPPASVVFSAVMYLINAAHGVSAAYDAIIELFDEVKDFTTRLSVHTRQNVSPELRGLITRVLVALLGLCDTSTKAIKDGRIKLYFKNVWSKNEKVQEQLSKLRHLTDNEAKLVAALSLVTITSTSKVVNDVHDAVNSHQTSLNELKQQVSYIARNLTSSGQEEQDDAQLKRLETLRKSLHPTTIAAEIQDGFSRKLVAGTGEWLHEEPAVKSWLAGDLSLLWLAGGPGAGKSFLSSAMIRYLQSRSGVVSQAPLLAYFFCRDYDPNLRSFTKILRSISYQLAQESIPYTKHCLAAFQRAGEIHTLQGLWQKLFLDYFWTDQSSQSLMLLIDGVDEAFQEDRKEFFELWDALPPLTSGQSPPIKLILVGRPELGSELEDALADPVTMILVSANKTWREIGEYVSVSVAKIKLLQRVSEDLRKEIVDKMIEGADGMFLWVDLMTKELATKRKVEQVRQTLSRAPRGLSDTLRHVLERFSRQLDEDDKDDLNDLLAWVVCAKRPLQLGELDTIMKLRTEDGLGNIYLEGDLRKRYASFFHVARDDGLTTEDLQHLTFALETVQDAEDDSGNALAVTSHPKTTSVHLAHASIGDFFRQDEGCITAGVGVNVNDAEMLIIKTCLRLWCEDDLWNRYQDTSFTEYVTSWWPCHLQRIDRSKASANDKAEIGKLLIDTMSAELPIFRWSAKSIYVRKLWEYDDVYCKLVHEWLTDPDAALNMNEEEKGWLAALQSERSVIDKVILHNGMQWLQGKRWWPERCFQSTWAHIQKNKSLEGKAPPPEKDLEAQDVTAAKVFEAARWHAFTEDAQWHARVGRVLRVYNLTQESIEEFKICISLDPGLWLGYSGLAFSYVAADQHELAIENWLKAFEIVNAFDVATIDQMKGERATMYFGLGESYSQLNMNDHAVEFYEKALPMKARNDEVLPKLLTLLNDQGKYAQTIDVLSRLASMMDDKTGKSFLVHDALDNFLLEDEESVEPSIVAALNTGNMDLIRDTLQESSMAAKKASQIGPAAALQFKLAWLLMIFYNNEARAVQLWEQIMDTSVASSVASGLGDVRIHAAFQLAMRYLDRAFAAEKDSPTFDENVSKLEGLAQRRRVNPRGTDDSNEVLPYMCFSTRDTTLALGKLYQMTGDETQARECFKSHIKYAISLLDDDDPDNDWITFHKLADAFRMYGDDQNTDAAYCLQAVYKAFENEDDEDSDEDDEENEDDKYYRENDEWTKPSKGRIWDCDGYCGRSRESMAGYHVCRMCLDTGFCDACFEKLLTGELPISLCSSKHDFYVVPQLERWVPTGKVKYKGKWIPMLDWIQEVKKAWGI